jgi:hypothetical protein
MWRACLVLLALVRSSTAQPDPPYTLLSGDMRPFHYNVSLTVDMDNFTTEGEVTIQIEVLRPTSKIVLNAQPGLVTISKEGVTVEEDGTGKTIEVTGHGGDSEIADQYWVELGRELNADESVRIKLFFQSILAQKNSTTFGSGFFISSDGAGSIMAVMMVVGRFVMPCFDEPALKATFTVSIAHSSEYSSLTNMPVKEKGVPTGRTGYVRDTFITTEKMSTYLLSWVVSKHVSTNESLTSRGIPFRVFSAKNNFGGVKHAAEIGAKIMDYFEQKIFRINYSLPKMDFIAVPDMPFGAMEQWGLITFRPLWLGLSSLTIGHELAHQWTGNLVTAAWINDFWLNEGFATFFSYYALEAVQNKSLARQQFMNERYEAFNSDVCQLKSCLTRPDENTLNNTEKALNFFKGPTSWRIYARGACMLGMLRGMLGEEALLRGIRAYLTKHSFSTVTTADLWASLQPEAPDGLRLDEAMDPWLTNSGFPVVSLVRNQSSATVTVFQQRLSGGEVDPLGEKMVWPLWFSYHVPGSKMPESRGKLLPALRSQQVALPKETRDQAVVFNKEAAGYFRVQYGARDLCRLAALLRRDHTAVAAVERAQIIMDTAPLALPNPACSTCGFAAWFHMVDYLKKERDIAPWGKASEAFISIQAILESIENEADKKSLLTRYKKWIITLLTPLHSELVMIKGNKTEEQRIVLMSVKVWLKIFKVPKNSTNDDTELVMAHIDIETKANILDQIPQGQNAPMDIETKAKLLDQLPEGQNVLEAAASLDLLEVNFSKLLKMWDWEKKLQRLLAPIQSEETVARLRDWWTTKKREITKGPRAQDVERKEMVVNRIMSAKLVKEKAKFACKKPLSEMFDRLLPK